MPASSYLDADVFDLVAEGLALALCRMSWRSSGETSFGRAQDAVLFAFDLLERDGDDLRDLPLIERKRAAGKAARQVSAASHPVC